RPRGEEYDEGRETENDGDDRDEMRIELETGKETPDDLAFQRARAISNPAVRSSPKAIRPWNEM
ncbi:MAG TPA: hypothetical protein VLO30_07915, partial [Chthoniobacterales bacterium]|nr:hypothetical protein [Chthoniobacterales bacterium]